MPAISPRTQSFQAQGQPQSEQDLFTQGFSSTAYGALLSKFPALAPSVVTFKVLESDIETGAAVGVFILEYNGTHAYAPAVLADNKLKPLDLLYVKESDSFVPFTKQWLDALTASRVGHLGAGATPPRTMPTDVDIRNAVIPPTTGRYSYASDAEVTVAKMSAERSTPPLLLNAMTDAPNHVKAAMARVFEASPDIFSRAVTFHGASNITKALQPRLEKRAAEAPKSPKLTDVEVFVADSSTPISVLREVFGTGVGEAFTKLKTQGYAAKDTRPLKKQAIRSENYVQMEEPRMAGVYKFWKTDGTPVLALVQSHPLSLFRSAGVGTKISPPRLRYVAHQHGPAQPYASNNSLYGKMQADGRINPGKVRDRFVGVTEGGELIDAEYLKGAPLPIDAAMDVPLFKRLWEKKPPAPQNGETGVFVRRQGDHFSMTFPVKVVTVTHAAGDRTLVKVKNVSTFFENDNGFERTLVIDPAYTGGNFLTPANGEVAHVPSGATWIPFKGSPAKDHFESAGMLAALRAGDFLQSPRDIIEWRSEKLASAGAHHISVVKKSGEGGFNLLGKYAADFPAALRALMSDVGLSQKASEEILKEAAENSRVDFWAIAPEQMAWLETKVAAEADEAQAQMQQMAMLQAQQPPQPTPLDMAVAEQMQNIQGQMLALQQQQQMLMQVQQRAGGIANGGGAAAAPEAAAAALGGPQAMGPAPVQGFGDPSQMGGGGDPAQMVAQQAQEQGPPQALMPDGEADPEALQQQVNPDFLEAAGQLNDAGVFDASLLASMAQSPALVEMVEQHGDSFHAALDGLGRTLFTLWVDEGKLSEEVGHSAYARLEDSLRTVFRGLGALVLNLKQQTRLLSQTQEHEAA